MQFLSNPSNYNCSFNYRQDYSKMYTKGKGTRIAKTILKKRDKVGRTMLPNFKNYHVATENCVVQTCRVLEE